MPARRVILLALTLCILGSTSAAAATAPEALAKAQASKAGDVYGYAPVPGAAAAAAEEIEPNDGPGDAQPIAEGESIDAGLGAGDVDWYRVSATSAWLTLSTSSSGGSVLDTVVDVLGGDGATLLVTNDDGGNGLFAAVLHFENPGNEFFVAVRHFAASGTGDYVLAVEAGSPAPAAPANDAVDLAQAVECGAGLTGTTLGAASDAGGPAGCVEFDMNGPEVFYHFELPYSFQGDISLFPEEGTDLALYVFLDPGDPIGSCVAGADFGFAGEAELISYVNEIEGPPVTLYVAVDSWSSQVRGDFVLNVSCTFVVANEEESWGALKARFDE